MNTKSNKPASIGFWAYALTWFVRGVVGFAVLLGILKARRENAHVVPKKGPAIIAPNHISTLDPVILIWALRRNIAVISMAEMWNNRFVGKLLDAMGLIPVDRHDRRSGVRALVKAKSVLEWGELAGIYPEGGCSTNDASLREIKPGVARLAWQTKAVVIPVGYFGTNRVLPLKTSIWKMRLWEPITIRFGEPLDSRDYDSEQEFLAAFIVALSEVSEREPAPITTTTERAARVATR